MDTIIRGAFVYFFLLLIFRISGRRTLANISTFDFVLTLIISESVQQAMIDSDNSITNAVLLVITLVGLDILLGELEKRFPRLRPIISGSPITILRNGKLMKERMTKERVGEDDILEAAREKHGLHELSEIDFAVIEASGGISVVPRKDDA